MALREATSPERSFVIAVTILEADNQRPLARLATIFGRRGLDIIDAQLSRASHGTRVFTATFKASPEKATTLAKTFLNSIFVVGAELFDQTKDNRKTKEITEPHLESSRRNRNQVQISSAPTPNWQGPNEFPSS